MFLYWLGNDNGCLFGSLLTGLLPGDERTSPYVGVLSIKTGTSMQM